MDRASENIPETLRKAIRVRMNDMADHIAGGGCGDYADYKKCCGVVEGLAWAERELLDLAQKIDDD